VGEHLHDHPESLDQLAWQETPAEAAAARSSRDGRRDVGTASEERRVGSYAETEVELQRVPKVVVADSPSLHLAQEDQFTGVASLLIQFPGNNNFATCTGTLLDDRKHILTAAHCLTDDLTGEITAID